MIGQPDKQSLVSILEQKEDGIMFIDVYLNNACYNKGNSGIGKLYFAVIASNDSCLDFSFSSSKNRTSSE